MKNIITLILLTIIAMSCKAQTIIKPVDGGVSCATYNPNCYQKDTNNDFEKFVGTWKYQDGNTIFTIKLKKELHYQIGVGRNYMDLLVGEYQYIEDGVEKANTLNDFNNPSILGYEHKISGGLILHRLPSFCVDNSQPQETKLELSIQDPNNYLIYGEIILRHLNDNGTEKLEVCLRDSSTLANDVNANIPMPDGFYVFVKQN